MRVVNSSNNMVLGEWIKPANTFFKRFAGLMFRNSLNEGEGLLLRPCSMVHSFFMRIPIDVVFINKENMVEQTIENLKPWRFSAMVLKATVVIELPAGTIKRTNTGIGDHLYLL